MTKENKLQTEDGNKTGLDRDKGKVSGNNRGDKQEMPEVYEKTIV